MAESAAREHGWPSCLTVDPANPTGPRVPAYFPLPVVTQAYKTRPVDFENLRCAREVLTNPARIFEGIRELNEGGWCYTGRPSEWYLRERVIVPFPRHLVFAVYLSPAMWVYEWRAERADEADPLCPLGYQDRYRRLAWKSTS